MHMEINPLWIAPFALLLGSIALGPLVNLHWWEKRYPFVAIPLGLLVGGYYLFGLRDAHSVLHTLHEYFSFIALIGALFVAAGGVHMRVRGEATPFENVVFLTVGSVLASLIGTTGASMVMIRPWIRMNRHRIAAFHVVFFIFLVSNIGGGLTPIGDPPLFLGFLKGVPFFWIGQQVIVPWLFTTAAVLASFFALDWMSYRKQPAAAKREMSKKDSWGVSGVSNLFFLALIVASVFISKPLFLREAAMIALAFAAYRTTSPATRRQNNFHFAPMREVAVLFFGIFLTMIPALQWMESHAASLGLATARQFYWGTGLLSAALDNAPTYLNFLSIAIGLYCDPAHIAQLALTAEQGLNALRLTGGPLAAEVGRALEVMTSEGIAAGAGEVAADKLKTIYLVANRPEIIKAISLGSVFFGAMTYIGNGPNFLVKSIADHEKVRMPSFLAYVAFYAVPVLLPIFAVVGFFFLR